MRAYHDTEWGVPLYDDRKLFEFLVLEGMQAGLSWLCVLNKRENFRRAFDRFDPEKVARYGRPKVRSLLRDAGIIRNRLKVEGGGGQRPRERYRVPRGHVTNRRLRIWRTISGRAGLTC